jgi:hypothetical protein
VRQCWKRERQKGPVRGSRSRIAPARSFTNLGVGAAVFGRLANRGRHARLARDDADLNGETRKSETAQIRSGVVEQ